eukprot:TRINITY_DN10836_c0_g1_i5.p1 TRINITY_DN10836_c0_g1~~TRINITY_DN10836_c0_g1_i5.p1  ORF type:complete len:300 (-),score=77.18 TRINITY_DN10836_c0_g1_i5:296-1195(-)
MDEIERCILVKPEVYVYKIPPRQSSRGYRAADWNLSTPDWTGRMRVMEKSNVVTLKLEDKGSNELFAACPIDKYPGPAIEAVTDSSRYFVIRIMNEATKQTAFIGLGFADRSDSFDLNVALQDHFKLVQKEDTILKEEVKGPQLDLAFKEGQTIKVNINNIKKDKERTERPKAKVGGAFLPPPPAGGGASSGGGSILPPPPAQGVAGGGGGIKSVAAPPSNPTTPASNLDLLSDFCDLSVGSTPVMTASSSGNDLLSSSTPLQQPPSAKQNNSQVGDDLWGDFASADSGSKSSGNWVTF